MKRWTRPFAGSFLWLVLRRKPQPLAHPKPSTASPSRFRLFFTYSVVMSEGTPAPDNVRNGRADRSRPHRPLR